MRNLTNAPKIYVGTYGQYNSGSLFGKWFDLTGYADLKEFLQDCHEFHRNEFDSSGCRPELMFQDWENIPDFLISECSLHKEAFAYFEATDEMDEGTAEAFEIYCKQINYWPSNGYELEDQIESFRESYQGFFGGYGKDATLEYAYHYVEDAGLLSGVPQALERYFDYEAFAKDLFFRRIQRTRRSYLHRLLTAKCSSVRLHRTAVYSFYSTRKRGSNNQMLTIIFQSKISTTCDNRCF